MKKIMILGGSQLQVPAIMKAKELGYEVIVVDYDKNAVGFQLADIKLLVSTIDQEEVYKQALIYKPDYIMTSTSDAPVKTAAYINEKLGKPTGISYDDAICATNKEFMRKRLRFYNVPIPKFYIAKCYEEFKNAISNFSDLCIIKPADNAGSRGVQLFDPNCFEEHIKEMYEYTLEYSRNGVVLIEEYMIGKEVSVEAMTVNSETFIITVTDKMVTEAPFFVELGHSQPSMLNDDIKRKVIQITKNAIHAIGIVNGPSHTEIKITSDGPKVVEIAARLGGDFITSKLVPISTGVDIVGSSVLLAIGEPVDLSIKKDEGVAIRFICGESGYIKKIKINDNIQNMDGIVEIKFYKEEGDYISSPKSSNDRIGHVITKADTAKQAIDIAEKVISQIDIQMY